MRRIPILPTLIVGVAVAVMIALGLWQLQRAEWKERLIVKIERSATAGPVAIECAVEAAPEVRAGRSLQGEVGYRYLVPCRPGDAETLLDIGWSKRPDALRRLDRAGAFAGHVQEGQQGSPRILVLDRPVPPLEPSARPSAADIPNNHLLYAIQWFFFAAAAILIYALALRGKNRRPDRG